MAGAAEVLRLRAEIDFSNTASFALFCAMMFRVVADREGQFGPLSVLELV